MAFLEKFFGLFEPPSVDDLKSKQDVQGLWKLILKNDPQNRTQAKEALAELGSVAAPFILDKLKGPNRMISGGGSYYSKAYRILYLSNPEILEVLRKYRNQGDLDFRRKVSELIAYHTKRKAMLELDGGSDQIQRLIKTINNYSENDQVRIHAARKLAELGDKRAVNPLIEALRRHSSSNQITFEMALALVKIGERQAIQPIERVLGRLKNLGSLNHIYWKYARKGKIHPELQERLNNLLSDRLIALSPKAELIPLEDIYQWEIKDSGNSIFLSKGGPEKLEEMPGTTYYRMQVYRSRGDRFISTIAWELNKLKEKYKGPK
jgi:hypothetical protein